MRLPAVVALSSLALILGGCGGDDGSSTESSASPTATPATTETPASTPEQGAESGEKAPSSAEVTIKGFEYLPPEITVAQGGKVTWTDEDKANHTVTFDGDSPEDIGNIREGESKSVSFEEAGTFDYVCVYHPGMTGTVVVR